MLGNVEYNEFVNIYNCLEQTTKAWLEFLNKTTIVH